MSAVYRVYIKIWIRSKEFRGVSIDDLPLIEGVVERNIFIYDFDFQEGEYVGELARRSIGKFEKTVKLLRFNNHIIHTNDIDPFLVAPSNVLAVTVSSTDQTTSTDIF